MRLVSISANVFVNPDSIDCIEQREIEGTHVTYIWVGERSYVLTVPFEEFYRNVQDSEPIKEHFAG